MLAIGDQAADFSLADTDGNMTALDDLLRDGELILYFYPADFSPVCTAEACLFRDNFQGVEELGISIVGVSPQSVSSHKRFATQFKLPFPLLSDVKKTAIRAYGVDGMFGIGVRRVTYLIDRQKTIKNRVVADLSAASHLAVLKDTLSRR